MSPPSVDRKGNSPPLSEASNSGAGYEETVEEGVEEVGAEEGGEEDMEIDEVEVEEKVEEEDEREEERKEEGEGGGRAQVDGKGMFFAQTIGSVTRHFLQGAMNNRILCIRPSLWLRFILLDLLQPFDCSSSGLIFCYWFDFSTRDLWSDFDCPSHADSSFETGMLVEQATDWR